MTGPDSGRTGSFRPYLIAGVTGAALWLGTSILSGRQEAWDTGSYWAIAYPLGIAVVATLAYAWPHPGAWRLGPALMLAQAVVMTVTAGSLGLLPLGLVLFGILSLPLAGAAALVARLRG